MAAWDVFGLHPAMVGALARQGFTAPTPIQEACLMPAISGRRDIIGAAQTVWLFSALTCTDPSACLACVRACVRACVHSRTVLVEFTHTMYNIPSVPCVVIFDTMAKPALTRKQHSPENSTLGLAFRLRSWHEVLRSSVTPIFYHLAKLFSQHPAL